MIGLCVRTAARADSVTPLGTYNASDMVVDSARDQVIVSAGPGSTELQVLSYDGEILDSIGALGGPVGITVVGSTLYAAEYDDGAISAVDLTTNSVTGPVATGLASPAALVYAGGRLWTSGLPGLVRVNPSNGNTTNFSGDDFSQIVIDIAVSPTNAGMIVTSGYDDDGHILHLYDVTSTPTLLQ